MSSTRLLVLFVVRFAQPVHGYDVRRELLSRQLEDVANVKPGSIYSALKTLERDGCLAVAPAAESDPRRDAPPGRPERTLYTLTGEGEKEFQTLLRRAWWTAEPDRRPFVATLSTMSGMPRGELIAALASRIEQLRGRQRQEDILLESSGESHDGLDGGVPAHVRELLLLQRGQARAEIEWAIALRRTLRDGAYQLADDPPRDRLGPGVGRRAATSPEAPDSDSTPDSQV